MTTLAIATSVGNSTLYSGGIGVNDGDVVIAPGDISRFDEFTLFSLTGSMQVFVSVDGVNFSTAAVALIDIQSLTDTPVAATVAGSAYGIEGPYSLIKVQQTGATAVTGACLRCSKKGGER